MGLLTGDDFVVRVRIDSMWDIQRMEPHECLWYNEEPTSQVIKMIGSMNVPLENFPSSKAVLSMIARELQTQYGCQVEICYEREFNPKISLRPVRIPYIRSWLRGTYPIIIYIANYYEHPERQSWHNISAG